MTDPAALQGEERSGEGIFYEKKQKTKPRKLSVLHPLFTLSFLYVINIQSFLKIKWLNAQVASASVQM